MRLVRGGVSAGLVGHFQSEREISNCELLARSRRNERRFDSFSPHHDYAARLVAVALNKASHGDGFFVAASPPLQSRACWRR